MRGPVRDALAALGVRRLVLGIHDLCLPSDAAEDTGRGSLYSEAGLRFLRFAYELGFDGIQLGPQGEMPETSTSPYDGSSFSRSVLSISLSRLAAREEPWCGLLPQERLAEAVAAAPPDVEARVPHRYVLETHRRLLREAFAAFRKRGPEELASRLAEFRREHAAWLERDALYAALQRERPGSPLDARLLHPRPGEAGACARRRRAVEAKHREEIEWYGFAQFLAHEQHRILHRELREIGLDLFGDLQIGFSQADAWSHQSLFLDEYRMGAPPSRTNPEGQAWDYPVFDPEQYGEPARPGPVLRLVSARLEKMFTEYDGVRIDHPHGLVCPWVYRRDAADALRAVQSGARLLSSPDLPAHPGLARFAIARADDLNPDPRTARHADDWVVHLDAPQVDRYSLLFDAVVEAARRHGRSEDLVCEVLSTLPYPLGRVLERHGLGRLRVTQKANLDDPDDVYRSENAKAADWIMPGSHDTPPLWQRIDAWAESRELGRRARHLAERLVPEPERRAAFAERLAADPGLLAQAECADLFTSPARHVMIFFTDLLGLTETYNRPGVVSSENWSLRVPRDVRRLHAQRCTRRRALDLPLALSMALRARGPAHEDLARRLAARG